MAGICPLSELKLHRIAPTPAYRPRFRARRWRAVTTIVAALLLAAPALLAQQPAGTLELVSVTTPVNVDNQVFAEATGSLSATIGHTGAPAQYFLTVSRGGSDTFDPREMEYRFLFGIFATYLDYNIFT
ncbi:MAG: hypothetical protein PF508_16020, partial [Spirochaeta sp.]|nr:hypothetical protein [Spirochaeta sp.]